MIFTDFILTLLQYLLDEKLMKLLCQLFCDFKVLKKHEEPSSVFVLVMNLSFQ